MNTLHQKYQQLLEILRQMGSAAIAFSGGVDSTLLLFAAKEALGDKTAAFTAVSPFFPEREQTEARDFCEANSIRQFIIPSDVLQEKDIRNNPVNRCYLCKKKLFQSFLDAAALHGFSFVAEGSNMDDLGDYRPGLQAISELSIRSPLREAALSKEEIRSLSREKNLPTWDKPSYACLASRFVYGETITAEKLRMVDQAEQFLMDLGLRQMRVRIHGNLARIEVLPSQISLITEPAAAAAIVTRFREIGFSYVTLDLQGYRIGSMNETIKR